MLLAVALLVLQAATAFAIDAHSVIHNFRLAQKAVKEQWQYSPDLVCAKPAVHGLIPKKATGSSAVALHKNLNTMAEEQYIFEGLPIYASCQLYISHKFKFIYIRQPKSSSTAIKEAIRETFCGEVCDSVEFTAASSIDDTTWRAYFVFTWIRNPFTRLASAFDMMNKAFLFERTGNEGHEVGDHCAIPFEEFSENTNVMRSACPERKCCVYIAGYQAWIPWFIDQHINDQSHCVFANGSESMVDFVGRTEDIDTDWAEMLTHLNKRLGSTFKPKSITNPNGQGEADTNGVEHLCSSERMQKMYNETTMWGVAHQYANDLHRFQYLPPRPAAAKALGPVVPAVPAPVPAPVPAAS